jgi:putative flavoprotein involved in K+ transport
VGDYVTAPEYQAYLKAYAQQHGLRPRQAEVTRIERQDRSFAVQFRETPAPQSYATVAVATGMYDSPIWPDMPGLPTEETKREDLVVMHAKHWRGPSAFQGQRLLVIGGASGAVEIAEECAGAGLPVVLSARSGVKISAQRFLGNDVHDYFYLFSDVLPRWVLGSFCDRRPTLPATDLGFARFRKQGLIEVRGPIDRFEGKTAHFADGQHADFDVVVAATGFRFDMPFLPAEVARAPAGHPLADDGESRSWPGLYFIGIPCCRSLVSEFLRGIAKDAPSIASRIADRRKMQVIES